MKTTLTAGIVCLAINSGAQAQQAVQWKVSDGGNGHWYGAEYQFRLWADAKLHAESIGGHLATTTSQPELDALRPLINNSSGADYWLGASRSTNADPWVWVTGEPFSFTHWAPGEPDNGPESICLEVIGQPESANFNLWNDETYYAWGGGNYSIIEWSADCNGDGIVDYGQCYDGTLPDYNGNNIPDCCERGEACVVSNYPVQWRIEDDGNGHWYATSDRVGTWDAMRELAVSKGGDLASIQSIEENRAANRSRRIADAATGGGPWIGGRKFTGQPWQWSDGSEWRFTNWAQSEPCCGDNGLYVHLYPAGEWNDHNQNEYSCRALIEWSADCNSDGIVDYGQILTGQLADLDLNGVPDVCQQPTCHDADIYRDFNVNGADLGILLSQWGPNTPLTESDLNSDGVVNGADLGILLSFWGACP
jgi:hypothetical protein